MTFIDKNLELLRKLWCKVRGKSYYRREKTHLRLFVEGREIPVVSVKFDGPPAHPLSGTFTQSDKPVEVITSEKFPERFLN